MLEKTEIINTLKQIHEDVFCFYCECCRLDGECPENVDDKVCNRFKKIIDEIESRLE